MVPTQRDRFDATDGIIGPCIHTVNQQLIKPITARAGGMSWALMLHPEGLPCDLFVTHCWREGIYEFIDKVLNSWPGRARHAYCCMLSNPQTSDIANLISSPSTSPFARALRASSYMLVVPNQQCSIYSRIWCAYEAFLAYSDSKPIFTASAPVLGLWREVSQVVMTIVGVFIVGVAVAAKFEIDESGLLAGVDIRTDVLGGGAAALACFLQLPPAVLRASSPVTRSMAYVSGAISAVYMSLTGRIAAEMCARNGLFGNFTSRCLIDAFLGVGLCIGSATMEADRLWLIRAQQEASQLLTGYTGRLRDASASKEEDKEKILEELIASGMENDVDSAIQVLLHSGVSSPMLRTAVANAGNLEQASSWNLSMVVVKWTGWVYVTLYCIFNRAEVHWHLMEIGHCDSTYVARACMDPVDRLTCGSLTNYCRSPLEGSDVSLAFLGLFEVVAWLISFIACGRDKRGFAAAALIRILGIAALLILFPALLLFHVDIYNNIAGLGALFFGFGPVTLILSIAGPGRTSRVPLIGPLIVKFLMFRASCQWRPEEVKLQETGSMPAGGGTEATRCRSLGEEKAIACSSS